MRAEESSPFGKTQLRCFRIAEKLLIQCTRAESYEGEFFRSEAHGGTAVGAEAPVSPFGAFVFFKGVAFVEYDVIFWGRYGVLHESACDFTACRTLTRVCL